MSIGERVAYLKGLAEGLGLDGGTKEGKLFSGNATSCFSDFTLTILVFSIWSENTSSCSSPSKEKFVSKLHKYRNKI